MEPRPTRRAFLRDGALLAAGAALALRNAPARAQESLEFAEYRRHDALGLAELVRKGEASPAELLEIAIARTEAVNPALNAVVIKHYERAREAIRRGLPEGPFRGVPYLLKDLGIALKGTLTTQGSVFFLNAEADHDSTLVERYREAGLVIFGKTHSPEFGGSPSRHLPRWTFAIS